MHDPTDPISLDDLISMLEDAAARLRTVRDVVGGAIGVGLPAAGQTATAQSAAPPIDPPRPVRRGRPPKPKPIMAEVSPAGPAPQATPPKADFDRRLDERVPCAPAETRPRFAAESAPINVRGNGGSFRAPEDPKPVPQPTFRPASASPR